MENRTSIDWLTLEQVKAKTAFGCTTIYDKIKTDNFPPPVKLGHASRWVLQDVEAWMWRKVQEAS